MRENKVKKRSIPYLCFVKKQTKRSPFVLFYLLVGYVILQFAWWAFLIYDLNLELASISIQSAHLDPAELENQLSNKVWMIFGEGTVFLTLLVLGFIQVKKAFQREVAVAHQQHNFLLSVTHELNSPLASVKLYLQTLLKRRIPTDKQVQILENALAENERLSKLVTNVLLATRMEDSSFNLYMEEMDLATIFKRLLTENPKANQHKVEVVAPEQCVALMDQTAFESIVANLFENAIKYSEPGSTIKGVLQCDGNSFSIALHDEGQGISEADKKLIFDKFYRSGNEDTRKSKGTGLGLYIVQFLANALKAVVTVNSSAQGSTFTITWSKQALLSLGEQGDMPR